MLNSKAFANAVTVVTAVFYVICLVVSRLAPNFLFQISRAWIHVLNLESIKSPQNVSIGLFLFGLVTISVITWVTTYATIELYNKLAKK